MRFCRVEFGAGILGSIGLLGLALGATQIRILWLALRQSLTLVLIGIGVGMGLAFLAVRPLLTFLTAEVRPTDAMNFVVVGGILVLIALLATIPPAIRALRVDPGITLRQE